MNRVVPTTFDSLTTDVQTKDRKYILWQAHQLTVRARWNKWRYWVIGNECANLIKYYTEASSCQKWQLGQ